MDTGKERWTISDTLLVLGWVCQGSERTLPEGAGTQRDAAGKESWN